MSQDQTNTVSSILNFVATVVIITAVLSITETIGAALGIWLWLGWAVVYLKILNSKISHVNDYNAGDYHVPTSSTDTGIYMVVNGTATPDTMFGYLFVLLIGLVIVCTIGYLAFGSQWKKGLFWFWTPIFALPLYLYAIGIIQYYPGGSKAYVETYYQSTCGIGSNGMKQCTWRGPVVKPPF